MEDCRVSTARVRRILHNLHESMRDLRPLEVSAAVSTTVAAFFAHRAGLPREFFVECADEAYRAIEGTGRYEQGRADHGD